MSDREELLKTLKKQPEYKKGLKISKKLKALSKEIGRRKRNALNYWWELGTTVEDLRRRTGKQYGMKLYTRARVKGHSLDEKGQLV